MIVVILILCNILGSIHPFIMKKILEIDFQAIDIQNTLVKLVATYLFIHIGYAIFKNIRNIKVNQLMAKILKDIRKKTFDKVLKFKMKTFEKYNSSQLYTRLTDDVNELFTLFFGILNVVVNNVLYLIFMVIMMFFANISLAWIGLATICTIGISTMKFTNVLGNIMQKTLRKRDLLNKQFSELYNKSKLTYLYQLEEKNIEKSNILFNEELKTRKEYIFVHNFTYWVLILLEALGIYSVLYYALNIETTISIGSIYMILFYIKECRHPLDEICNQLEEIQNCIVSYKRVKEILKEKEEEDLTFGEEVDIVKGDIEFQNVCMRYEKEKVLNNISFCIKEGSKVTIAGRTGARKINFSKCFDETI